MTNKTKRLFLFAAYDKYKNIDDALLYYLRALSELGDIIFFMDNYTPDFELEKVRTIDNVLYAGATRHGEYDFGSYKRAYQHAAEKNILEKYDWIYLVNDSVYGPMFDLGPVLDKMETANPGGAYGMIGLHPNPRDNKQYPDHVQSWFVGIASDIARQPWFATFMNGIERLESKDQVVWKYEIGLSQLLISHGINLDRVEKEVYGLQVYLGYIPSLPFLKKLAIRNIKNLKSLRKTIPAGLRDAFQDSVNRLDLNRSPMRPVWKIKLFNKITMLSWERHENGIEHRLRIFKIIPIKFLRYKEDN